jgi:hypothetical protein
LAGLLGLLSGLLGRTPAPAIAAEAPTVTANFHAIGLYWTRTQSPDRVAVQYRRTGAVLNGTDDAIKADNSAVNVRIWGNYIDYALTAISHQYMEAGPRIFSVTSLTVAPIMTSAISALTMSA